MSMSSMMQSSVVRAALKMVAAVLVSAVAFAPAAQAQAPVSGNFTFVSSGTNGTLGGIAVGPYRANLAGFSAAFTDRTNAPIWCVDFVNGAPTTGVADTYWATAMNGTDFSKTRMLAKTNYAKAAWLIEQYDAGAANFTAINVQGTIWKLMNPGSAPTSGFTDLSGLIAATPTLTKTWFVMSDKIDGTETSNQEYLYTSTVPEPSTYLLMASGLGVVGMMARRRRRGSIVAS